MSASTDFCIKQLSVIEFLTLEGCAPVEIHRRMKAVYGDDCMDVKNVCKWVRHAKSCYAGEISVLDEHRSGRPISVTHDENQCRVDAMIQENRQMKKKDIALKLDISQERLHHINETLNYRKVCTRWVLRQLTDPRMNTGKLLLKNFLTDIVSKGMISSRIMPLETNSGFIIMTRKTKGNPWNIVIHVLRV